MSACPFSLPHAVRAAARRADLAIDLDALVTVLALPWLDCTVPTEPEPGRWPTYARDAFLEPASRLFGLTIRGIHPPEASRGLHDAAEFDQHFDASYRPLILRALEHGQPVLAWQGWHGEHEFSWGLVEAGADDSAILTGRVFGSSERSEGAASCVLERPAVQVYVVESVAPATPSLDELWSLTRRHARTALQDGLRDRFGVTTGPAAYDAWLDLLRVPTSLAPLCAASACAHDCAARVLDRISHDNSVCEADLARTLRDRCREVAAAMGNLANAERTRMLLESEDGRRYTSSMLRSVQAAGRSMLNSLIG